MSTQFHCPPLGVVAAVVLAACSATSAPPPAEPARLRVDSDQLDSEPIDSSAAGAIEFSEWDCLRACGRTGRCPQPVDLDLAVLQGPHASDRASFEDAFGCSTGIDFARQRPHVFVEGGSNLFPRIGGVRRVDGAIAIDVIIDRPCRGAEDDARAIFVVLLPRGDESVEVFRTSNIENCGSLAPP